MASGKQSILVLWVYAQHSHDDRAGQNFHHLKWFRQKCTHKMSKTALSILINLWFFLKNCQVWGSHRNNHLSVWGPLAVDATFHILHSCLYLHGSYNSRQQLNYFFRPFSSPYGIPFFNDKMIKPGIHSNSYSSPGPKLYPLPYLSPAVRTSKLHPPQFLWLPQYSS